MVFDVRIQERRRDLSLLISWQALVNLWTNEEETNMPTPYMLEHRRRPHAYDTYTGGVPSLSSLFKWNLPDFVVKDESGNALLASWLHPVSRRNGPQVTAKIVQMSDVTKKSFDFFSFLCPSAALWVPFPITKRGKTKSSQLKSLNYIHRFPWRVSGDFITCDKLFYHAW